MVGLGMTGLAWVGLQSWALLSFHQPSSTGTAGWIGGRLKIKSPQSIFSITKACITFKFCRYSGVGVGVVARKVLLSQLVFAPPMLATFFIGMSVMEGKPDITKEFR